MVALTEFDRDMLAYERLRTRQHVSLEESVRALFAIAPDRYFERLSALVDRPEALAADPQLVTRVRRRRGRSRKPGTDA